MKTESTSRVFTWRNRKRTIFKRYNSISSNSPWYIRLRDSQRDKWINLGTDDPRAAQELAERILAGTTYLERRRAEDSATAEDYAQMSLVVRETMKQLKPIVWDVARKVVAEQKACV